MKEGITFVKIPEKENQYDISSIEINIPPNVTKEQVVETFIEFLVAAGYYVDHEKPFE